jgi:hypothetical protein
MFSKTIKAVYNKKLILYYLINLRKENFRMENNPFELNCIQNFKQFNQFINNIDNMRQLLSYFNFSQFTQNKKLGNDNAIYEDIFVTVKLILYTVVILVSLIGNLFIIIVICFDKSKRKSTNLFIFNLAICDMAILISCTGVQFLMSFKDYWIFGEMFCKLNSFLQMLSVLASVLTLLLIACDRYVGILHPFSSKIYNKNRYYYFAIGLIWVISILIALPTYIYRRYQEREWLDFVEPTCDDTGWPIVLEMNDRGCATKAVSPFKRIYYTCIIILLFFLPFLIMVFAYSIMIHKLWRNKEEVDTMVKSSNKYSLVQNQKRGIIMLVVILATFFLCWSPLELMVLYQEYTEKVNIFTFNLKYIINY